jgi:hypothetical protein
MTAVPNRDAIPDRAFDRRDVAAALVAGAIAAVAYGRTLAPGLTADADSPLFQFIGRVLGVAHNPGYPLYALLTWPVAQIPIGSLAWRINLFSAMTGAVAVALTTLAARSLGCGRIVAAAAALGFGLGATFWAQAVVAEVYTLNAALAGGALAGASAWARTGRPGLFYAALACVAAGLAHHTTIAAFVPALAALALVRDRRFALRARTIAASAAILACGLLPYALILVRSGDPQAYVESRATTIPDLARVVLGGQFRDRLLAEPWSRVLAERVPVLVERVLVADLTVAGLALAAIGTAWLAWRRTAEALALALAAGPIAAFAVAYAVVDTPVFLLPVLQILWLAAGVGWQRLGERAAAVSRRPAAAAVVAIAACALPGWLAWRHHAAVDRSADHDARPLERLFDVLPDRSAIVSADFITDRMLHYLLLGADAARGRDIRVAPRDAAAIRALAAGGVTVVALPAAAERLRFEGLDVAAAPVPVYDGTLDMVAGELPDGALVALAVPAGHRQAFDRTAAAAYARLGAGARPPAAGALAIAGTTGGAAPRVQVAPRADLRLGPGETPWPAGRGQLEVVADGEVAAVRLGGRDLLRTRGGAALAVWTPDGRLLRAHGLQATDGFLVPLPASAFSAHAVLGAAERRVVAPGGWVDVTAAAATGSLTLHVPAGATLELRAADAQPLAPRVEANVGRGPVELATARAPAGRSQAPPGGERLPWISTVTVGADPAGPVAIRLSLGGVPRRALARLADPGDAPAAASPVRIDGLLRGADGRSSVVTMSRGEPARAIGAGWSAVESDDAGPYRWITEPRARVLVPPTAGPWRAVRVEAFRPGGRGPATIALAVGAHELPAQPLRPGWADYEWQLPAAAAGLGTAPVDVTVRVDAGGAATPEPAHAIAVASLRFTE